MSSAISNTLCRVVLERSIRHIRPMEACQRTGPSKQTTDYVFSVHRLMGLDREWKAGFSDL